MIHSRVFIGVLVNVRQMRRLRVIAEIVLRRVHLAQSTKLVVRKVVFVVVVISKEVIK